MRPPDREPYRSPVEPYSLEEMLGAVRAAATPEERPDPETLEAVVALVRSSRRPVRRTAAGHVGSAGRKVGTRLAAAAVVTILTAGTSLAITGELPTSAKEVASDFLARIGLPAPSPRFEAEGGPIVPHTTGELFTPPAGSGLPFLPIAGDDFLNQVISGSVPAEDEAQETGATPEDEPAFADGPDVQGGHEGGNGDEEPPGQVDDEPGPPQDPPGNGEPPSDPGPPEDPGPPQDPPGIGDPPSDPGPPEDPGPPQDPGPPAPPDPPEEPAPPQDPPGNGQPPSEPGRPSDPGPSSDPGQPA